MAVFVKDIFTVKVLILWVHVWIPYVFMAFRGHVLIAGIVLNSISILLSSGTFQEIRAELKQIREQSALLESVAAEFRTGCSSE